VVRGHLSALPRATTAAGPQAAIRGARSGQGMSPQFPRQSRAVGRVGDVVRLSERHIPLLRPASRDACEHVPAATP